MNSFFSAAAGLNNLGHANYEFLDVNVLSDQRLFIDPSLIFISPDPWCRAATATINNYFDNFFEAYRRGDLQAKHYLLSCSREINDTRLGYGSGNNGHGNTADGLLEKFACLDAFVRDIPSISSAADLPVLITDFDKDGLSDMITNIIRKHLYDFTMEQLARYNVPLNSETSFWSWDAENEKWVWYSNMPSFYAGSGNILLVPKGIVQKHYLYRAEHFFKQIVLERIRQDSAYVDDKGKTKLPPKKEIIAQIERPEKDWKHDFIINYAAQVPQAFTEYHQRTPEFYANRRMTDEELDFVVYGQKYPA